MSRTCAMLLGLAFCLPVSLATDIAKAQEVAVTDESRQHFEAGVAALQKKGQPDYGEAYRQFSLAYEASPTWKILGNLGIAAMHLERDGEAIEAIEQFLRDGGPAIGDQERKQFEQDLTEVKRNVTWVNLLGVAGASIRDTRTPAVGEPVTNAYEAKKHKLLLGLRAGDHSLVVHTSDGREEVWEIVLQPGQEYSHDFSAGAGNRSASPEDSGVDRPLTPAIYIGLGTTAALAIGGSVTGVLTLGYKSNFDEVNDGSNETRAQHLHDKVKTFGLTTDILFGAAVLAGGVTTYLYFTRPEGQDSEAAELRIFPVLGRNTAGVGLSGGF